MRRMRWRERERERERTKPENEREKRERETRQNKLQIRKTCPQNSSALINTKIITREPERGGGGKGQERGRERAMRDSKRETERASRKRNGFAAKQPFSCLFSFSFSLSFCFDIKTGFTVVGGIYTIEIKDRCCCLLRGDDNDGERNKIKKKINERTIK